jgi:hypothetical protein
VGDSSGVVSHWACNRWVAGSIPSSAASRGVSVVDALLRIPLGLRSPSGLGRLSRMLEKLDVRVKRGPTLVVAKPRAIIIW